MVDSLSLGDLMTAYEEFDNKDNIAVDYLIMFSSSTKEESQAKQIN